MAIESAFRPLGMLIGVNVKHDQRNLAPVGTFRTASSIRIYVMACS
jgi:hypothetical protein